MTTTTLARQINAPVADVFAAVAHIDQFSEAIPHIERVEFLSDQQSGLGTRFRETRSIRGREATTTLEVTDYVPNERVRLVSDSHGTVWDTTFTTTPQDGGTYLEMRMDARPHTFFGRITTFLLKGMIEKEIEKDLDLVKNYCENRSDKSAPHGRSSGK